MRSDRTSEKIHISGPVEVCCTRQIYKCFQPVVEVGAVGQIFAAQLARLPHVSQAGDEVHLNGVIFTMLVKLLPRLSAPVGADLQTHIPNKQ